MRLEDGAVWDLFEEIFPKAGQETLIKRVEFVVQQATEATAQQAKGNTLWKAFLCAEQFRLVAAAASPGRAQDTAAGDQLARQGLLRAFHIHRVCGHKVELPPVSRAASLLRLAQIQRDLDRLESKGHRADKAIASEEQALVLLIGWQAKDFADALLHFWQYGTTIPPPTTLPAQGPSTAPAIAAVGSSTGERGNTSSASMGAPSHGVGRGASEQEVPHVKLKDLHHGMTLPWAIKVLVVERVAFYNNTGFKAVFQELHGTHRISAFFFREAARLHSKTLRSGVQLLLTARSRATGVRAADAKWGGGFQLVVGPDARLTVLGGLPLDTELRISGLPPAGCRVEELVAVVMEVGDLLTAQNGSPYRKMHLVDESCGDGPANVTWTGFGHAALGAPAVARGQAVRLRGPVVKEWSGRKQLQNGVLSLCTVGDPRAQWLQAWWKGH